MSNKKPSADKAVEETEDKAAETKPKAAPKIFSVILKEAYKMPDEKSYAQINHKGTKTIEFYGPYCILVDSKFVIPLSNVKGIDLF